MTWRSEIIFLLRLSEFKNEVILLFKFRVCRTPIFNLVRKAELFILIFILITKAMFSLCSSVIKQLILFSNFTLAKSYNTSWRGFIYRVANWCRLAGLENVYSRRGSNTFSLLLNIRNWITFLNPYFWLRDLNWGVQQVLLLLTRLFD